MYTMLKVSLWLELRFYSVCMFSKRYPRYEFVSKHLQCAFYIFILHALLFHIKLKMLTDISNFVFYNLLFDPILDRNFEWVAKTLKSYYRLFMSIVIVYRKCTCLAQF